jgi:hypothetical protein
MFGHTGLPPPTPRETRYFGRRCLRSHRVALLWGTHEPQRGRFTWPDALVKRLTSRRITPYYFMLRGCPRWASHGGSGRPWRRASGLRAVRAAAVHR